MKVTVLVDLVEEVHEGPDYEVFGIVDQLMTDGDDVKIVSVEMTPEEQITAFEAIVDRWEI